MGGASGDSWLSLICVSGVLIGQKGEHSGHIPYYHLCDPHLKLNPFKNSENVDSVVNGIFEWVLKDIPENCKITLRLIN